MQMTICAQIRYRSGQLIVAEVQEYEGGKGAQVGNLSGQLTMTEIKPAQVGERSHIRQ